MHAFLLIFSVLFGAIIGSFLNVVILRHNTGRSLQGRSGCPTCGKTLQWYELLPLVSFLVQRGACRSCKTKISVQYPLVELATGLLCVLSFWKASTLVALFSVSHLVLFLFYFLLSTLYIIVFVYDLRHKIIPDRFSYTLALITFLALFVDMMTLTLRVPSLLELVSGLLVAAPFVFLWGVSGGRWMGLGDAKLALSMGWLLGVAGGFAAVLWGFWLGALWSVVLLLHERLREGDKRFTMKSEIPLGPFLIVGVGIVLFTGFDLEMLNTLLQALMGLT